MSELLLAIAIVTSLVVGLVAGYVLGRRDRWLASREKQRQEEIERRLKGPSRPRHRATAGAARVKAARIARSHRWS